MESFYFQSICMSSLIQFILIKLQFYIMNKSTAKRLSYAAEIRRKQRNQIIVGLRSKLLESFHQTQIDWDTHSFQPNLQPTFQANTASQPYSFHQVYNILFSIVTQYNQSAESKNGTQINLLHHILLCEDGQAFCIANLSNMIMRDFKNGLSLLPQLIKSIINQIDINFARLKITINSHECLEPLKKIQRCSDIKNLAICFNTFLREYNNLVSQSQFIQGIKPPVVNVGLIELITDCLIQCSCFKPRFFKQNSFSPQVGIIFNAVNQQMSQIIKIMNFDIRYSAVKCIEMFSIHQMPMVLFSNYIYIIGNVFICMNSHQSLSDHLSYIKMHNDVLNKFQRIITEVVASKNQFNSANQSKIIDFCSLVIWFLRNQILISLGMFDEQRPNINSTLDHTQTVNTIWLNIVFGVFDIIKQISLNFDQNVSNNSSQATIITEALSLIQMLYFDFSIDSRNIQRILDQLICFRRMFEKGKTQVLTSKIYEFLSVLSCTPSKEWVEKVVQEASYVLQKGLSFVGGIKFCAKIVEPDCKLPKQLKLQLLSHICGMIDCSLQEAQLSSNNESIQNILSLLFSAAKADEYFNLTLDKRLLNNDRVRTVLQLCSRVWQNDLNPDSIVESLELIRFLSYKDEFASMMKEIILKAGYYEQLQILSQNSDEELNRLVYEIYEALEIQ